MVEYHKYLSEQNRKRKQEQEKLYDYYIGQNIENYLDAVLNITFNEDDIQEFQKDYINITKKCVNQLSVVYRDPAKRSIIVKEEDNDDLTEYYNSVIPANVNTIDKTAHRYAKLLNTSLTRVYFDDGKIKYSVLPSHLYDVKVSDENPYKITEVCYKKYLKNDKGEDELYLIFWTDKEHYKMPLVSISDNLVKGDKLPMGDNEDTLNPYGVIPFAVCRLEEQNDCWGTGLCDLVNTNEQINFLLTNLINDQIVMGTAGTLLAVNLGLQSKKVDGSSDVKKVRTGRKHPITVEGVTAEMQSPSLEHVSTDPQILEIRETVDWHIKMIAMSKGLNPNSFLAEVQATSGFSKVMDALEQLEIRRDDIEPCRQYEDDRYKITKAINNTHKDTTDGSKYGLMAIPDDAYLKVDFAEITPPQTVDEKIADSEFRLKHNLISILDLAREQNPDLTDEELEESIKENKEINDRINATPNNDIEDTQSNNDNASEEAQ